MVVLWLATTVREDHDSSVACDDEAKFKAERPFLGQNVLFLPVRAARDLPDNESADEAHSPFEGCADDGAR